MEGLALILALAALVVAGVAVVLVLRLERQPAELSPGGSRTADLERHITQLVQRMDAVEAG